jgi:hypothetical protein
MKQTTYTGRQKMLKFKRRRVTLAIRKAVYRKLINDSYINFYESSV